VQGIEAKLDEHNIVVTMFQQIVEYNVHMTYIYIYIDLEIKNKKIIKEKDRSVQNLQGALEKEQKLKIELKDRNSENS